MRIAIVADVFPPLRSSGAVQLRDLSIEFARQGCKPTVILPAPDLDRRWEVEQWNGVEIVRLKAPRTRDMGYTRRAVGEFLMPFLMRRNLAGSPVAGREWDGVVWYSPTIFLGPLAKSLKTEGSCRGYLIVRDVFPDWLLDMKLIRRGLRFRFLKAVEAFQYSVADVIGVQSPANLAHFGRWRTTGRRVEVLQNWLAEAPDIGCSIDLASTPLAGRRIFVYAGNMGVAQGMDAIIDLAAHLQPRTDLGFVFVGRGSEAERLRRDSARRNLDNVLFFDEIGPEEIPGLFSQCDVGLVSLDRRHRTHNLPGKFLTYIQGGLAVLACVNPGNDLIGLIERERIGRACTDSDPDALARTALSVVDELDADPGLPGRSRALFAKMFSVSHAVRQILHGLRGDGG